MGFEPTTYGLGGSADWAGSTAALSMLSYGPLFSLFQHNLSFISLPALKSLQYFGEEVQQDGAYE